MQFGWYLKWISLLLTTLLVSEQVPLIKTIDSGPSEASQLLSTVNEFASGVKDNIAEMVTRPSDSLHENERNQNQSSPAPALSTPLESPSESPPESPRSSDVSSVADPTPHFWRVEGSEKIILVLDRKKMPALDALWKVAVWMDHWFEVLFPSGPGVDWVWRLHWLQVVIPAALGFFGGLGIGFVGWCRGCLSRREPAKVAKKIEQVVADPSGKDRRTKANAYLQSLRSQSYMMPAGVSASITVSKSEHAEETNSMTGRIAKKEEDADPLMVPPSLSDSSWYSPGSPLSPTPLNSKGLDLSSYDGFQPKPKVSDPNDLPDTLLGSSPSRSRKPSLPKISDPWIDYTPDYREKLS